MKWTKQNELPEDRIKAAGDFHALKVLCNLNTWLLLLLSFKHMLTCWKDVNGLGGEEGEIWIRA